MATVEFITDEDLDKVVLIHKDAFKSFFLTELGDNFLILYYRSVLHNKRGLLLGYYSDNKLLGFCAATTLSNGFYKNLVIDNILDYFIAGVIIMFKRPKALIRLFKNFTKGDPSTNDNGNYAELLSIAVSPMAQSSGIGQTLLSHLENTLCSKKCNLLSLTTDFENNEKAIGFYKKMGYKIMYDFIAYPNRHMYRLIKTICI